MVEKVPWKVYSVEEKRDYLLLSVDKLILNLFQLHTVRALAENSYIRTPNSPSRRTSYRNFFAV